MRRKISNRKCLIAQKEERTLRVALSTQQCQFKKSHITPMGGHLLAFRCAAANMAATNAQYMIMKDLHRTTMSKWEVRTRACLVARSKSFFLDSYTELLHHGLDHQGGGWKFLINLFRIDATNANVWQRSKLSVTEVKATLNLVITWIENHLCNLALLSI